MIYILYSRNTLFLEQVLGCFTSFQEMIKVTNNLIPQYINYTFYYKKYNENIISSKFVISNFIYYKNNDNSYSYNTDKITKFYYLGKEYEFKSDNDILKIIKLQIFE